MLSGLLKATLSTFLLFGLTPFLHSQTISIVDSSHAPQIIFEGNVKVSSQDLVDNFKECAKGYWETYDQRAYQYFIQKCTRQFLWSRGFFRAAVREEVTRLEGNQYIVRFIVTEGARYRWGKFEVEGHTVFSTETILSKLGLKIGAIANGLALRNFLYEKLRDEYVERGYVNYAAEFEPTFSEPKAEGLDGKVHVRFTIDEGRKFTVRKVVFIGVDEPTAKILKRDFLLRQGDVFIKSKFELAITRINETELFPTIDKDNDVEIRLDEEAGDIDIVVKLKKDQ